MNYDSYTIRPGARVGLASRDPGDTGPYDDKTDADGVLEKTVERLRNLQDALYAEDTHAVLVVLQGMDTCGKDGIIRHVMSGINPQGLRVHSFKEPSREELDHDFLWRAMKALPERGTIGVFNRSYYEEVIVVRVHPELLEAQKLPQSARRRRIWDDRFEQINDFEHYLSRNGIRVVKFFLHLSKQEQRERLLARIDTPAKNWKFSARDLDERGLWDRYMEAYEAAISKTSTQDSPWHVIPADRKWFARIAVAEILAKALESLDPKFPAIDEAQRERLEEARRVLASELEVS